jgi:hypothetical protein
LRLLHNSSHVSKKEIGSIRSLPETVAAQTKGAHTMKTVLRVTILASVIACFFTATSSAQAPATDPEGAKKAAPKVFIDCNNCDMDYIRTEITFVNYMRDRKDAQVHVLVTTQSTGSNGTEYTLSFSGQEQFAGMNNVLQYFTNNTDTNDEIRSGLVRILKIGFVSYAGRTPIASQISVSYKDQTKQAALKDRWNYWVFVLNGSTNFDGQKSTSYKYLYGSFSANRVTPAFKFRASYSASQSTDRFAFEQTTIVSTSKSHNLNLLAVKSITDHWSAGASLNGYSSTYSNIDLAIKVAPAIEYNFFPYSKSTRRQLRILWKPVYNSYRYQEETIYNKTREGIWSNNASVTFELKEKWGTIYNSFEASHYFEDLLKNRLQLYSELSLRLFKGLSLTLYGNYSRIHDQISLPKGEATLDEVLLRRTQLATSYSYYGSIGLSYTFGSMFSNVVNPRFGN